MKRLFVALVMVMSVTAEGQNTRTTEKAAGDSALGQQKAASGAPSLADTEQWIKNTLAENSGNSLCNEFDSRKQPNSEYGADYSCRNQRYSLDFEGCKATFWTFNSHRSGRYVATSHPIFDEGEDRSNDKGNDSIVKFNLGDIDPKTIRAEEPYGWFGSLGKRTFHANKEQVNVCVATTDSILTITISFPFSLSGDHELFKIHELCWPTNNFVTVEPEYAPRFVKALTHAVELCGGKSSAF
jgi:hypothetical protein